MNKVSKNEKGFSPIEGLLIVVIAGVLGFVGWWVWHNHSKTTPATEVAPKSATVSTANDLICMKKGDKYFTIKEWGVRATYTGSLLLCHKLDGRFLGLSSVELGAVSKDCKETGDAFMQRGKANDDINFGAPNKKASKAATDPMSSSFAYTKVGEYYYFYIKFHQSACDPYSTNSTIATLQKETEDAFRMLVPKLEAIPAQ